MLKKPVNTQNLDLDIFDDDKNRESRSEKHQARIEANKDPNDTASKRGNWLVLTMLAAGALAALFIYIHGDIERNSLNSEIIETEARIAAAGRENIRLRSELDSMATLARVEEFAAENGLVREQILQVTHLEINVENTIEIAQEETLDFFGRVGARINGVLEFLGLA